MAKAKASASDDETESDDDAPKVGKRPRILGPATVAKPCFIGAALLAVAAGALPR